MNKQIVLLLSVLLSLCFTVQAHAQDATEESLVKNPLEFNWNQGYEGTSFSYTVSDSSGNKMWTSPLWWPTLYNKDVIGGDWFSADQATMLIDTEQYGNIVALCHAGFDNVQLRACGEWHKLFEPDSFWLDKKATSYQQSKMDLLRLKARKDVIGWQVTFNQADEVSQSFEVVDVAFIPHEQVAELSTDLKTVIDTLVDGAIDPWQWQLAITKPSQYLVLIFEGWSPYRNNGADDGLSWSRYAILLKPINSD